MAAGQIKWRSWLLTIISWDGLLPPCILLVPYLIDVLFPNIPDAIVIAAVLLPITGFVVRLVVGIRHIETHQCSTSFRANQRWFLILGISVLVLIDACLITSHLMPNGAVCADRTEGIVLAVLASLHFRRIQVCS